MAAIGTEKEGPGMAGPELRRRPLGAFIHFCPGLAPFPGQTCPPPGAPFSLSSVIRRRSGEAGRAPSALPLWLPRSLVAAYSLGSGAGGASFLRVWATIFNSFSSFWVPRPRGAELGELRQLPGGSHSSERAGLPHVTPPSSCQMVSGGVLAFFF